MKAMILERLCDLNENKTPLRYGDAPKPEPKEKDLLLRVTACGVCHTELDEIEGRTPPAKLPVILGHQVVGEVVGSGKKARRFDKGDRVGVAWIFSACGLCEFCLDGLENLCERFRATGRDAHGGYAQYMTVSEDFAFSIPAGYKDAEAAPLLCAGAIGYRSLRLTELQNGQSLGLTGFGASAHLVMKMAAYRFPDSRVFVFARSEREQRFAKKLGACWAGHTRDKPPQRLDAVIDTTPAWQPVVAALANLKPGGRLVVNAIRKETADQECLMQLDYPTHLWLEKEIKSVANVARSDVQAFLDMAAAMDIRPEIQEFDLKDANRALIELKERNIRGAKVLTIG